MRPGDLLEIESSELLENHGIERRPAAIVLGGIITVISLLIVFNFDPWFDRVVTWTTEVSQPLLGLAFCIFVAWIWHRDGVLAEIRQGSPEVDAGLFWRIWPFYVKFICPLAILVVYFQ